jgi:hypothetical protein
MFRVRPSGDIGLELAVYGLGHPSTTIGLDHLLSVADVDEFEE